MKRSASVLLLALVLCASMSMVGCGEKEAEPSKETAQQSDRLTKIKEAAGGDWNKVSDADKQWLINEVCFGNEGSAKMMIAGPQRPKGAPSAPPSGIRTGP